MTADRALDDLCRGVAGRLSCQLNHRLHAVLTAVVFTFGLVEHDWPGVLLQLLAYASLRGAALHHQSRWTEKRLHHVVLNPRLARTPLRRDPHMRPPRKSAADRSQKTPACKHLGVNRLVPVQVLEHLSNPGSGVVVRRFRVCPVLKRRLASVDVAGVVLGNRALLSVNQQSVAQVQHSATLVVPRAAPALTVRAVDTSAFTAAHAVVRRRVPVCAALLAFRVGHLPPLKRRKAQQLSRACMAASLYLAHLFGATGQVVIGVAVVAQEAERKAGRLMFRGWLRLPLNCVGLRRHSFSLLGSLALWLQPQQIRCRLDRLAYVVRGLIVTEQVKSVDGLARLLKAQRV